MYSSNVSVEVRVEDTNDNSPSFNEPFYEVTVKEEQPSGTPILQVFSLKRSFFYKLRQLNLLPELDGTSLD